MHKLLFYPRLAAGNLKRTHKTYVPFLLTCIGTVLMYYIMHSISVNPGIQDMPGAGNVVFILRLGRNVISLFAVIFLLYTNSFLIKRRKKEFGLYQVLGMEKRHLAIVLFFEALFTAVAGIVSGLISGMLLSKLLFLLLLRILGAETPLAFEVPMRSVLDTLVLFAALFAVIYFWNLWQMRGTAPVELMRGGQVGEREPRTKLLQAIVGVLTLGAGYFIAVTVTSPITAILLFFAAVILVIIGTYLLFSAGSIAVLKCLRANKRFYFQPRHFTNVSGMLYRMKQNAVGLANICILSTMVLVMLATTASLYFGQQDMLQNRFPEQNFMMVYSATEERAQQSRLLIEETAAAQGRTLQNMDSYRYYDFFASHGEQGFTVETSEENANFLQSIYMSAIPLDSWEGAPEGTVLAQDEVLLYTPEGNPYTEDSITLCGKTFRIAGRAEDMFINNSLASSTQFFYLIVRDESVLRGIIQEEAQPTLQYRFDSDGDAAQQLALSKALRGALNENAFEMVSLDTREETVAFNRMFSGGFFFIGLFLGALFLMATVLIIYYKQITEGYEDQARFSILQKVGMSLAEVRATIRVQVLMVFFLPLAVAVLHVAVAFPLLSRLLALFGLYNTSVFILANGIVILIFALMYTAVFAITAREYYKIVKA